MSNICIDPTAARQATSSFASQVVLIEGASAAAQTACAIAAPVIHLIAGLDGTLGAVRRTLDDIRSDCDRLVRSMNGCCTLYEEGEQAVYSLFGGKDTLYGQQGGGGIVDTFLAKVGNAVRSTIDSIRSAVERIDWVELAVEGFWTVVEIAGWVGTIAAACSVIAVASPVAVALGVAAAAIATVYLANSVASRFANIAAIAQGYANPDANYLKDFLADKLGEAGTITYYVGMFVPAMLVAGGNIFAAAKSIGIAKGANTSASIGSGAAGKATADASRQTFRNTVFEEASNASADIVEGAAEEIIEDETKNIHRGFSSANGAWKPAASGGGAW